MAEHHRRGDAQRVAQFGDVIGHLFQGAGGQRRSAGPPLPAKIDEDQLCRGGQGVQAGRRYPWSNPGPPGSTTMVGYSASRPSPARSCDPATSTYSSAPERLTRITYLHVHVLRPPGGHPRLHDAGGGGKVRSRGASWAHHEGHDRRWVLLRYFTDAGSYQQIAGVCGVPVGTVRSSRLTTALLASGTAVRDEADRISADRCQAAYHLIASAARGQFRQALAQAAEPGLDLIGPQRQHARGLDTLVQIMDSYLQAGVQQHPTF